MKNIKIISTEKEYEEVIQRMLDLGDPELGTEAGNEYAVLGLLADEYLDRNIKPLPKSDPVRVIKFVMEQNGYNTNDLAEILGSKPRASEILNRKRKLTLNFIRAIHEEWGIPVNSLVRDYALKDSDVNTSVNKGRSEFGQKMKSRAKRRDVKSSKS